MSEPDQERENQPIGVTGFYRHIERSQILSQIVGTVVGTAVVGAFIGLWTIAYQAGMPLLLFGVPVVWAILPVVTVVLVWKRIRSIYWIDTVVLLAGFGVLTSTVASLCLAAAWVWFHDQHDRFPLRSEESDAALAIMNTVSPLSVILAIAAFAWSFCLVVAVRKQRIVSDLRVSEPVTKLADDLNAKFAAIARHLDLFEGRQEVVKERIDRDLATKKDIADRAHDLLLIAKRQHEFEQRLEVLARANAALEQRNAALEQRLLASLPKPPETKPTEPKYRSGEVVDWNDLVVSDTDPRSNLYALRKLQRQREQRERQEERNRRKDANSDDSF